MDKISVPTDYAGRLIQAGYVPLKDFVIIDYADGLGSFLVDWKSTDPVPMVDDLPALKWVPREVSRAQARVQLFEMGLLQTVENAVANHPYEVIRIWYWDASTWHRDNAYLAALALELGFTDEQLDDMFIAAAARGL